MKLKTAALLLLPLLPACAATGKALEAVQNPFDATAASNARAAGKPILVTSVVVRGPAMLHANDLSVEFWNTSTRDMKYVTFTLVPVNRVGDVIADEIRGQPQFAGQVTGPVEQTRKRAAHWENAWYQTQINCVRLERIDVTYMDDSRVSLTGPDLEGIVQEGGSLCRNR